MSLNARFNFYVRTFQQGTPTDFGPGQIVESKLPLTSDGSYQEFTNGTGANQANKQYIGEHNLATTASVNIDLQNFTDPANNTAQSFVRVAAWLVWIPATSTALGEVGGAATNAWEGWISAAGTKAVRKLFIDYAPDATGYVVDATHKVLKVKNTAGTTGKILVWVIGN
jgi:hypothetical protein